MTAQLSCDSLLSAMDGVSYLVGYTGTILRVSARWDDFLGQNQPGGLSAADVLARDLFSMIAGEPVRQAYRAMHNTVLHDRRPAVTFTFRCDAPQIKRTMRMSISAVRDARGIVALLYQSVVLDEAQRPPIRLFAAPHYAHDGIGEPDRAPPLPVFAICSFCHKLAWPAGAPQADREWIEPETYYARQGGADATLSHTICPACVAGLRKIAEIPPA